jgi:hypothetical protein
VRYGKPSNNFTGTGTLKTNCAMALMITSFVNGQSRSGFPAEGNSAKLLPDKRFALLR